LPRFARGCIVIVAIAVPGPIHAQEWRFEPIVKLGLVTDDNATLSIRTDDDVQLDGYLLDVLANIHYSSSDITSFFLQPRALIRNYPDNEEFESDDFFLRSQFRHRMQSNTFGFRLNFDQQDIRTAERNDSDLDIEDPDEIPNDDTGLVGIEGDRSRWRVSPYWNYAFSSTSSMDIALDYFDVRYDDVFAGILVDYTDSRVNWSYRRALSNITTGILTLTGRRFSPEQVFGIDIEENTGYGLLVGFEHSLSEKTRLVAMIGVENTEQAGGQSDPEVIGNLTLTRDLQTISMFARYERAVTASGSGVVELRDTVNVNFNRRLSERIAAGFGVRAYHAQPVDSTTSIFDRNYVQLQALFSWYVTKSFVIEADYRYTVLDRSNAIGERSNSNQVGLWFIYQPNTTPRLQL
jgi:hypothetical protein